MKLILLIATLFIFSIVNGAMIERKKQISRTLAPEDLALEIDFYGTCAEFRDRVLPSVWLSNRQKCLPIQVNVTENPDYNDLHGHWFCTNTHEHRSILHLVEVFTDDERVAIPDFVFSFVPSTPFRILSHKTSLARRPNCWVTNDYCNTSNAVINNCKHNDLEHRQEKRFIVTHDRIYVTSNQNISAECKTSETECCPYITPSIFGGICDHEGPTDLLEFPKDDHKHGDDHKEGHHDDHHDDHHRPEEHHDRPHEEHHDRPEEHHDRPHEEHHDRPHEEHHDKPHEEHHNDGDHDGDDRPHEEHHEHHEEHHHKPEHHDDGDHDGDDRPHEEHHEHHEEHPHPPEGPHSPHGPPHGKEVVAAEDNAEDDNSEEKK